MISVKEFSAKHNISVSYLHKQLKIFTDIAPTPIKIETVVAKRPKRFYDEDQLIKFIEKFKSINNKKEKRFGKHYNENRPPMLPFPKTSEPITSLNEAIKIAYDCRVELEIPDKY